MKSPSRIHLGWAAVYFILPLIVWGFTSIPGLNRLTPFISLVGLAVLVSARFIPSFPRQAKTILWTLVVVSLVGATGWFYSPFFFALYLMAIVLGFLYTPTVSVTFTVSLLALFASSLGELDPTADFLTLLSLLSVIPITIALRKSFLLVQQEKKGILILESDSGKESGITSLDAILSNQVNRVAILIRQPITYIRQGLSLLNEKKLSSAEGEDVLKRMGKSADEVFTIIKEFESQTTKHVLLGRKRTRQADFREIKEP